MSSSLSVTAATTTNASIPCYINPKTLKNLSFPRRQLRNCVVYAAKDDKKLQNWDQMELKFGKLIGENPELTLSKIKDTKLNQEHEEGTQHKKPLAKTPNVILWKSTTFEQDNAGTKMSSSLSLKPNLSLKIGKDEDSKRFSDMILVRNPESSMKNKEHTCKTGKLDQNYEDQNQSRFDIDDNDNRSRNLEIFSETGNLAEVNVDQSQENRDTKADSVSKLSADATLLGSPKRLDQPVKEMNDVRGRISIIDNLIANFVTSDNLPPIPLLKDREDMDWERANDLIKTSGRGEVEMISCSTRGFIVSFGSLIGFLPYRNLATKWKFVAFESWLRTKGVDPATYRKHLGITGNFDATSVNPEKIEGGILPHMKLEDLLTVYDQEKLEYLSTFVGQKVKVYVILVNRESRKLVFSVKPKEKEESVQRKRKLMAKLNIGDIVTCCIKKISYFGIFVEIDGVPALIHQTEVSWDATSNPTTSFKIGQVVEAKVHQLDYSLERISLSLKEITPDPLTDALEAVVSDHVVLDDTSEADQPENEWVDLELLVKELEQYEGIELVTKGRFFLSPGLTQTFQVYMASMFKNQYKLLARAGNKVQEVVVHTWLGIEEMKHAILMCTNQIE